jgi:hypothetical protein
VGKPRTGKALTNEVKYPYIVELAVRPHETNAELNGRIIDFHRSRKIQARPLPASESRLGVPVASSTPDEEIPALLAPDARSRSTLMLDTD